MYQFIFYEKLHENVVLDNAMDNNVILLLIYHFSRRNLNSKILIFQKLQE